MTRHASTALNNQLRVNLAADMRDQILAHAKEMSDKSGENVNESAAIRDLIRQGLAAALKKSKKKE